MNWNMNYIIVCIFSVVCGIQGVTDEEYAYMPDVFNIENYETCMLLKDKALYCDLEYKIFPVNPNNPPEVWKTIKAVSASELHYRHDIIRHFTCVPKTCPNVKTLNSSEDEFIKDLNECFDNKYKSFGFRGHIYIKACKGDGPIFQIDMRDWIFAIVFFVYVSLVMVSTAYDTVKGKNEAAYLKLKQTMCGRLILAFSIKNNWTKLKSVPTGPTFEKLRSVQGLRVYMSIVIIVVHAVLGQFAIPNDNPKFFEDNNDNPNIFNEVPKRSVFILSFFFMMSSWILITSILVKQEKNEDIDFKFILKSIAKRYIRFLPSIALIVGFYATWLRHLPWGPFFDGICNESEKCRQNWWTNLLFIQNHYNRYYMCYIISWYLAVEMQYYIITLFILMWILRNKISVPCTASILLTLNLIFAFLDHYRHGYLSTLSGKPEEVYRLVFNSKPQWHDHFASYHGNATGYILGLGFGYISHKYTNKELFDGKWKKVLWCIVTFTLMSLVFILPLFYNVDKTPVHSALWVVMTRLLFSFAMGLFVLGLSEGLGGPARSLLNWSPLYTLGKLSYCVYIGHVVFQNIRVGMMRSPQHLGYYAMLQIIASDTVLSFIGALWLCLFFEMPSNELANILFVSKQTHVDKKSN
ncbi:nose resistant to fluoxetine protein 6-like [Diorhabda sublineata]|uniref:nose resistant to fluoxetine protein 6-like n=1 Tax=Diorhabda sublineata TaxID=1163346 RepID=UPI0024E060A9|nr:nose resistant to fluoxetine protein 6-like [Diorhabda sublineata]